jgi:hypothetical protein
MYFLLMQAPRSRSTQSRSRPRLVRSVITAIFWSRYGFNQTKPITSYVQSLSLAQRALKLTY